MRIGALNNPELVNSNYRSYQPLAAVARRGGHEVVRNQRGRPLSLRELLRCDVVHVHRVADAGTRSAVHRLQDAGIGIVWDNDDDLTAIPRWNPNYHRLGVAGRRDRAAGIRDMLRLADVVTTPSSVLAEQFRALGARDVRVIENHLPPAFMASRRRQAREGIVIACAGALEHQADYQRLQLREVLSSLLDEHSDVRVLCVGVALDLPSDRCRQLRRVPFYDLVDVLATADVGIAPLIDIPWNQTRSNVKLKEYAAAGLAWLASPVGPYLGMGGRQGGRLVPDDGWREGLARLIVKTRERRRLAKQGAKWVKQEAIDLHARVWEQALHDAAEHARPRGRISGAPAARRPKLARVVPTPARARSDGRRTSTSK